MLKQLHEATVLSFINSLGFGVERRVFLPGWLYLPEADPIPFRAPLNSAASDTGLQRLTVEPDAKNLEKMHHKGVLDFVNPPGFGYIIDREHVHGFQPHHFHSVPEVTNPWQVQRIELVSLLMHETPVVYVSQNLPRMQELAGAPHRPLTAFEEQALAKLRKGSDLVTEHSGEAIRVLGGIRALKQCCPMPQCRIGRNAWCMIIPPGASRTNAGVQVVTVAFSSPLPVPVQLRCGHSGVHTDLGP